MRISIHSRMMDSFYHLFTGLLLTVHILGTILVQAQNTNFSFSSFPTPESFVMIDDVQYNAKNLSFMMNSKAHENSIASCGMLLYKDRVRMKESSTGAGVVASFSTAFTFKITGQNIIRDKTGFLHADGMAFTFTRDQSLLGKGSGSSLCLLDEVNNGLGSNHVFAVEFDTFRNSRFNDSSDSHIGVNLNSMNSTYYHNLCGGTVANCSYLCNGGYFTAWIDYDGVLQKLEVRFARGSLFNNITKPPEPLIEASFSLATILDDYMYVGFTASTGALSEVHEVQSWKFTSSGMVENLPAASPPSIALNSPAASPPAMAENLPAASPPGTVESPPAASPPGVVTNPVSNSSEGSKVGLIARVGAGVAGALLLVSFV